MMQNWPSILLTMALIGCGEKEILDADLDGFEIDVDCNDSNPGINPEVSDFVGDGIDQNCDGIDGTDMDGDGIASLTSGGSDCDDNDSTDEASIGATFYMDSDNDGFGNAERSLISCEQPVGFVDNDVDCDDGDALVNPDAVEVCDGVDNDCDDKTDDADDSVEGQVSVYVDTDMDGFGTGEALLMCELDEGFADNANDCDDNNIEVHPNAIEVCDDLDNDCDTLVDDADDSLDLNSGSTFFMDADVDGYGDANVMQRSCVQPVGMVANSEDCNDGDAQIHPMALEVCDGVDNDCDMLLDDGDDSWDASTGTSFYADMDQDGYGDENMVIAACVENSWLTVNGGDCDDSLASSNPQATDIAGDGIDQNCDDIDGTDVDGDGVASLASGGMDCNDNDANIHPMATEVCDNLDNDCDGDVDDQDASLTDSGTTALYLDADGDGFGYGVAMEFCSNTAMGYVGNAEDCDDQDASLHPNAVEICDGIDQNCNNQIDEGLLVTLYLDSDGDGYGDAGMSADLCPNTDGYVGNSEDCDDNEEMAYPGSAYNESQSDCMLDVDGDGYGDANVSGNTVPGQDCDDALAALNPMVTDIVGDGIDQNCDAVDGLDADGDGDASVVSGGSDCDDNDSTVESLDVDGDGVDTCSGDCDDDDPSTIGDDDNDGYYACIDDCDDDDPLTYPGAPEIYYDNIDQDCAGGNDFDQDGDGDNIAQLDCDGDGNFDASCDFDLDGNIDYVAGTDCDDTLDFIEGLDSDGDGVSVCDGDCWEDSDTDDNNDGILDSSLVYPGVAYNDSLSECLEDLDGDGFGAQTEHCYVFETHDTYGDGWNGNRLDIYENGVVTGSIANSNVDGIANNVAIGGESETIDYCLNVGTTLLELRFVDGSYNEEVSFSMFNEYGTQVASGQGETSTTLTVNGTRYATGSVVYSETFAATDCDDDNPDINIDAVEICDNGIDEDCDGFDEPCVKASCLEYYALGEFNNGLYTITQGNSEMEVYCDMSNGGITYEDFGFGAVIKTYTDWEVLEWTEFQETPVAEALSHFYNLHGLTNLDRTWSSSNCCITSPAANRKYGFNGQLFMYPSVGTSASQCGGVYSAAQMYVWGGMGQGTFYTLSVAEITSVNTYTGCGGTVNNNPGIFVKRWL